MIKYISFLLISVSGFLFSCENGESSFSLYVKERESLVSANRDLSFARQLHLSSDEVRVSSYFEELKKQALSKYQKQGKHPSSINFLGEKENIQSDALYHFLKKMPKGALLHVHSGSIATAKWMVEELTKEPNCYVYWQEDGSLLQGTVRFYQEDHVPKGFFPIEELRASIPDFNRTLISMFEMELSDLENGHLWKKFEGAFMKSSGLVHYKPCFIKYYTHALEELVKDNIQYMELRSLNNTVYDLDGAVESPEESIALFAEIKKVIQKKYPDFNFSLIYTEHRKDPLDQKLSRIEKAYKIRSLYPDFVIGYDLVGEEDTGLSNFAYAESLQHKGMFETKYGVDLPCYFHAGESLLSTNNNLYDAVLLHSKRIGHAFNLFLFPYLLDKIISEDICIEVCPVSNQVLGYVSDLRIHPAAGYLKAGVPCVLSSDDPGLFGYNGMTPDIWEAVIAWDLDFKSVKQLCLNSLKYSGMGCLEKEKALSVWEKRWKLFIKEKILENNL